MLFIILIIIHCIFYYVEDRLNSSWISEHSNPLELSWNLKFVDLLLLAHEEMTSHPSEEHLISNVLCLWRNFKKSLNETPTLNIPISKCCFYLLPL